MGEIEQNERDLRDALARLKAGEPQNAELSQRLEKKGHIPINVSTVALEAGHSRTLIGYKNCRYPLTRNMVIAANGEAGTPNTAARANKSLREKNVELANGLALSRSIQAALLRRCMELEKDMGREKERRQRLEKGGAGKRNVVYALGKGKGD